MPFHTVLTSRCFVCLVAVVVLGCGANSSAFNDVQESDEIIENSSDSDSEPNHSDAALSDSAFQDAVDADVNGGDSITSLRLCNGLSVLCDRQLNEVVFPATHNSMSNEADGWLAPNQIHPMKRQLQDGIRAMLIDTYWWQDKPMLCHAICEIGSRPLIDAMEELVTFLNENPNEVVVLLIEDHLDVNKTVEVFDEVGLTDLVYTHSPGNPWPTLGEMIDAGHRVVVTVESKGPPPLWYHHMWDLVFDTPYSFKATEDFTCELNRGDADNELFLLNHWLSTPLPTQTGAQVVNQYDIMFDRAVECLNYYGRKPNFVAVDFYSEGDIFRVVMELNLL